MGFYLSFSNRFFPQALRGRHFALVCFTVGRLLPGIFKIPEHASIADRANPMADGWEPGIDFFINFFTHFTLAPGTANTNDHSVSFWNPFS
jgi:hypothetical protein